MWMLDNVRRLLAAYTFRQLLVRLAEEYLWWVLRGLPGFGGVWLRYLFLKATTKRLDGFCWISQGCTIVNSHNLSVGKQFAINRNVVLDAMGGIEIGDRSGIGPNCVLISHEHSMLSREYFGRGSYKKRAIRLGSDVWIGSNCFVKAGVTIGDRAVVGACSSVVDDVPPNGRVIGSPAQPYTRVMRGYLQDAREREASKVR